ncbi:MAG: T9SS type A sorting domain-containing protein [Bacteroidales bacterium]
MRNFLLVAWLILLSFASFSQGPAYFKIADKGGVGQVLSSFNGYLTLGCDSANHQYMVKWDQYFNPVWKLCFTDSRICGLGSQMIEAPDGSIYYATTTHDQSVCDGPTVIFKISADGQVLWQRAYIKMSHPPVLANAAGNSNGFILSGGTCGYSGLIVRCDPNGAIVWHRHYYFRPNILPSNEWNLHQISIVPDDSGYSLLSYYASAPQNLGHLFYRINDSGNLVGPHQAYVNTPGENHAFTKMIRLKNDRGFACVGYILTTSASTSTVVFLDTAFNLVSARKLSPGVNQFLLADLVSTPSGNAMIACGSIFRSMTSMYMEGVVVKMDRNGNMEWFKLPKPFNNHQYGNNIGLSGIMMKNNRLFAGAWGGTDGATIALLDTNGTGFCKAIDTTFQLGNLFFSLEDTLILNSIHAPSDSMADLAFNRLVYINKVEYCGEMPGVTSLQGSLSPVSVYPVPANGYFVADPGVVLHEAVPFRILDIHGKQLMAGMIAGPKVISTTQWKSGVYLFQVLHHGQWSSVKFMVTNP